MAALERRFRANVIGRPDRSLWRALGMPVPRNGSLPLTPWEPYVLAVIEEPRTRRAGTAPRRRLICLRRPARILRPAQGRRVRCSAAIFLRRRHPTTV